MAGIVTHLSPNVTLLITSDLGNLEDRVTKRHTPNPVPLIAIGPAASHFRAMTTLSEVTPTIYGDAESRSLKNDPSACYS
ncbi:MAG: hypothetical protein ACFB0E_15025 [Leptolyngbyaceae cyanobacterium]